MKKTARVGIILALGMLPCASPFCHIQAAERTAVLTTTHFAFYSDFATNLHDALIAAGLARKHGKPELFHSGDETSCFSKLPESARAGWDGAVDYYAKVISPADWSDRQQYLPRVQLAGFDEELTVSEDRQFVEIAQNFRAAATPAYKTCRWGAQDEKNRRWIDDEKSRLAANETKIANRLQGLYRKAWDGLPIPVDIVETVSWSGANSILRNPAGGHILISTDNQGPSVLEIVFHEASHLLMRRDDPVQRALADAARSAGYQLPDDLWHVVLFYTTGEAVRRILDEGGKPPYTPMLYEIFNRSPWDRYRKALESDWSPYLNGARTLAEAAAGFIDALRQPATGAAPTCPDDTTLELLHDAAFNLEHRRDLARVADDVTQIQRRVSSGSPGAAMVLSLTQRIADLAKRDGPLEPESESVRADLHAWPCLLAKAHERFHRALPPPRSAE